MADLPAISVSEETYNIVRGLAKSQGKNVRQFMDDLLSGDLRMPTTPPVNQLTWPHVRIPPALWDKLEARGEANGTSARYEAQAIIRAVLEGSCS